jgi:hypothetical protein
MSHSKVDGVRCVNGGGQGANPLLRRFTALAPHCDLIVGVCCRSVML